MKQGWEIKRLGEVGTIVTGSTPSTKDEANYSSLDYCFIKPSDIPNNCIFSINESEYYISKESYSRSRKLPKGTVLTTCIGIIGKVGILETDATCNQQINAIVPNETVISRFLAYNIISRKEYMQGIANAPVVPIINKKEFSKIPISVPPLPVQERIVEELDCLSGIIEKKKEQLKELDSLVQSIFYEMFGDPIENDNGWEVIPLKTAAVLKAGKSIKANELSNTPDNGMYPCFGGNGIRGYISKKSHSGQHPIIGRQGALCGNVVFAQGEFYATEHAVVCNNIINDIIPLWMYYALRFNNLNRFAQGVAQPGISVSIINEMPLILPPLPLQQEFAKNIEAIEKQKELIKKSIGEVETLFNSRMDYYFSE